METPSDAFSKTSFRGPVTELRLHFRFETANRKLSAVQPYPNNPRINDDAVEAVMASPREFGFRQPIVVDTDGVIICGHTRYKAAQRLGLEQAPVHVATDLTPAQTKAYRIADNQTATLAEWNYDLLLDAWFGNIARVLVRRQRLHVDRG